MQLPNTSHPRPKCSVFIAMSVDGYIARIDGSIDWLSSMQQQGEDYGYEKFFQSIDTVILGRNTYDLATTFESWPYGGKRCVVLTHRPSIPRHQESFYAGSIETLLEQLQREGAHHLYIDGGNVIQQFLAAKRIDTLTISIVPILLGSGRKLFHTDHTEQVLQCVDVKSWTTGLVQLNYSRRAIPQK